MTANSGSSGQKYQRKFGIAHGALYLAGLALLAGSGFARAQQPAAGSQPAASQPTQSASQPQPSQSGTQPNQSQPAPASQPPAAHPSATAPVSAQPTTTLPQPTTTQPENAPPAASAPKDKGKRGAAPTAQTIDDAIPSPGEDLNPHIRPGSQDDVNAVGTRNIGGRGLGNWYSTESEIKVGKSYSMEVEKSAKLITDPVVTEYVNRIGQNIVKNSDCKVPFTIKVIDTDEVNAFALPGGFFYVNSGLILAADEEAELAGVMAHETAHVCAHHAMREMTRANYANIGMVPLEIMAMGSYSGYGLYELASLAVPITFLKFSRDFEGQADWLGLQYMYRAGYDPQALIQFFEKVESLEKHRPGMISAAFSTHPQTPDRIDRSEEEIATIMPAKPEYVVTTSEFDDVKARLARIENKRKLKDGKDANKPTLRRVGATDPNSTGSTDSQTGDDRPTLQHRDH